MTYRILYRCRECGEVFADGGMPERMARMEMAKLCADPTGSAINAISIHSHSFPGKTPGEYCADFLGIAPEQP